LPTDVAIFSAAVADFKIKNKNVNKIKKQDNLTINLQKNIDILHYVSNHNSMRPKLVIGFAAETDEINKNATNKLIDKNCDWILANDVSKKILVLTLIIMRLPFIIKTLKIKRKYLP
jgi:phosphopantothenoylcysteine decarboxylase/phosphopantothenate--cysteine ligase